MSAWNTIPGHDESEDTLDVYCWCQKQRVIVARKKVLDGQTESCGASRCNTDLFLSQYKAKP